MANPNLKLSTHNKFLLFDYVVVFHPELTRLDLKVFHRLLGHHNTKTDFCFPSVRTLAEAAQCSVRSVRTALKKLNHHKLIEIIHNKGPHGTNIYRFPNWRQKVQIAMSMAKGQSLPDLDDC